MEQQAIQQPQIPSLPEFSLVRVSQIVQMIPISEATWWRWVREGKVKRGIKLGANVTVWKLTDVREFIETLAAESEPQETKRKRGRPPRDPFGRKP
jgi:predicted DNA-binding transcriptional regulator AlpA